MSLTLKESRAITDIAELLYTFLPGSGKPYWKGHVSFKTIAIKVGVETYWQPGSKRPMIEGLLGNTLEYRRDKFETLITEIVRSGISYRQNSKKPIIRDEIEKLNGLLLDVGFKFPILWDLDFLDSLRVGSERAEEHLEKMRLKEKLKADKQSKQSMELIKLKDEFFSLNAMINRQKAGYALQGVLNKLFTLYGLAPKDSFRVVGEEIDGSFELDHEIYLLEAKWIKEPVQIKDLYVFREKIIGKSAYTRGIMVAINGVSNEAIEAISKGKALQFFVINGHDITMILSGFADLADFLRRRQRLLADKGQVVFHFNNIFNNTN